MSDSVKALNAISVSERGLPKEWPFLVDARQKRQRRERNSRIYCDWLAAEDKNAEVASLAERWALAPGKILSIIEKMKTEGSVVPHMAAKAEVLRQQKREQVLSQGQEYRDELEAQIAQLDEWRESGDTWVDIEEVEDVGSKQSGVKTRRVKISTEIARLRKEILRSQKEEAEALALYVTKPTEVQDHRHFVIDATEEFKEILNRGREVVDVEAEVEDAD